MLLKNCLNHCIVTRESIDACPYYPIKRSFIRFYFFFIPPNSICYMKVLLIHTYFNVSGIIQFSYL